jgi:hypothetical protein
LMTASGPWSGMEVVTEHQSSCRSLGVSRAMVYLSEFARGGPALDASVDFGNAGFSSVFWMT